MSSLYNVLDDYGLAENEKATKLVESLLKALSEMVGSEEPKEPAELPVAHVGTYKTVDGNTAIVSYDRRWCGESDGFVLRGHIRYGDGEDAAETWTEDGHFNEYGVTDASDLVIPGGHVHVHYVVVESAKHTVPYPNGISSYSVLAHAREDNCENLPILRITYRDDQIISAQLVNDWETS